jgi:hypothetical protein
MLTAVVLPLLLRRRGSGRGGFRFGSIYEMASAHARQGLLLRKKMASALAFSSPVNILGSVSVQTNRARGFLKPNPEEVLSN